MTSYRKPSIIGHPSVLAKLLPPLSPSPYPSGYTPTTLYPSKSDISAFASACEIDEMFDEKYMSFVNAAARGELPDSWTGVCDPNDKPYFIYDPIIDGGNGGKVKRVCQWEHPLVESVRDQIQDFIAADEKREADLLEAKLSAHELMKRKRKMDKMQMMRSIELVLLMLKQEYGNPELDDVIVNAAVDGFYTVDPEDVKFALVQLNLLALARPDSSQSHRQKTSVIPEVDETPQNTQDIKKYGWIARMASIAPLPETWERAADVFVDKFKSLRQYRDGEWSNKEVFLTEPPAFKYWRMVLEAAKSDDFGESDDDESSDDDDDHHHRDENSDDDDDSEKEKEDEDESEETVVESDVQDNEIDEGEYFDFRLFKSRLGRDYHFNFITNAKVFADHGIDDPTEQAPINEDSDSDSDDDDDTSSSRADPLSKRKGKAITEKQIQAFASACQITEKETKFNPKLHAFLKAELLRALPQNWFSSTNPNGILHYYNKVDGISSWIHPSVNEIRERHVRLSIRRSTMILNDRLKGRQDHALERVLEKTALLTKNARASEIRRVSNLNDSLHYSPLTPNEEALDFFINRYGPPESFLSNARELILTEMNDPLNPISVTPDQVLQMSVFLGVNVKDEVWLVSVGMCALLAPMPWGWYVVGGRVKEIMERRDRDRDRMRHGHGESFRISEDCVSENDGGRGRTSNAGDRGEGEGEGSTVNAVNAVSTRSISISMIRNEEESASASSITPQSFARDINQSTTHVQQNHPSDPYWRAVLTAIRSCENEGAVTKEDKINAAILPFYQATKPTLRERVGGDGSYAGVGDLYYYNFLNGGAVYADAEGGFDIPSTTTSTGTMVSTMSGKRSVRNKTKTLVKILSQSGIHELNNQNHSHGRGRGRGRSVRNSQGKDSERRVSISEASSLFPPIVKSIRESENERAFERERILAQSGDDNGRNRSYSDEDSYDISSTHEYEHEREREREPQSDPENSWSHFADRWILDEVPQQTTHNKNENENQNQYPPALAEAEAEAVNEPSTITTQKFNPKNGKLHVGYSGIERTLNYAIPLESALYSSHPYSNSNAYSNSNGRYLADFNATPWELRGDGEISDKEFESLYTCFYYGTGASASGD